MSEIKFRGKRIDNGEWVYGFYGCKPYGSKDEMEHFIIQWNFRGASNTILTYFQDFPVQQETVGQYTGLKDKNEIGIYEGDVVWCRAGEHSSGVWEYEKRFAVEYGWTQSMWEMSMCEEIEVIGNIHDNPGLVGGKNEV